MKCYKPTGPCCWLPHTIKNTNLTTKVWLFVMGLHEFRLLVSLFNCNRNYLMMVLGYGHRKCLIMIYTADTCHINVFCFNTTNKWPPKVGQLFLVYLLYFSIYSHGNWYKKKNKNPRRRLRYHVRYSKCRAFLVNHTTAHSATERKEILIMIASRKMCPTRICFFFKMRALSLQFFRCNAHAKKCLRIHEKNSFDFVCRLSCVSDLSVTTEIRTIWFGLMRWPCVRSCRLSHIHFGQVCLAHEYYTSVVVHAPRDDSGRSAPTHTHTHTCCEMVVKLCG